MTESHDPSEGPNVWRIDALRVLDAAANRASEGLRVVEDFARFVLDDVHLTRLVKELRHDLASACGALPWRDRHVARETQRDVGTTVNTSAESQRADAWAVCSASFERAKQSLRSLEEYSKVASPEVSPQFEKLRYRLYTVEKSIGLTHDSLQRLRDVRLCVLVDGRETIDEFRRLLESLVGAGVEMIQFRDQRLMDAELVERARLLVEMARRFETMNPSPSPARQGRGMPIMVVNDRADIAAAVDADGVHLGQDDLSVKDARRILGPRKLIGTSTHDLQQARAAVLAGANYLGAGPTFPSSTKAFDAFPGLEFLRELSAEVRLPTFAIGGIGLENLPQVLETGTRRVAVRGAVVASTNVEKTVKAFREMLRCGEDSPPATAGG
ncbi:MAG: thiamine phosphate synthase [Planctomycetes bacterium]|nr:thiamine phosphate synthase [Planctomycetota bacterium]